LITSPKKKGKFNQKLAEGETGERHVPPAVQASVDDMGDVGRGNDGEENNLVLLASTETWKTLLLSALARTQNTWQKHIL
jgi:hypothetical protein